MNYSEYKEFVLNYKPFEWEIDKSEFRENVKGKHSFIRKIAETQCKNEKSQHFTLLIFRDTLKQKNNSQITHFQII